MRIGLIGAGRIGTLHARLLKALEGVDELFVADAEPARATGLAAAVGATAVPDVEDAHRVRGRGRHRRRHGSHGGARPREPRRGRPTYCEKPLAGTLEETIALADWYRGLRRAVPAGVPTPVRRGISRGAPDGRERRARHGLRVPAGRPRSGTAARGLYPDLGRAVQGLLGARLRHHPLAARARGRGGLRRRAPSGDSRCSRSTTTWTPAVATLRMDDGTLGC